MTTSAAEVLNEVLSYCDEAEGLDGNVLGGTFDPDAKPTPTVLVAELEYELYDRLADLIRSGQLRGRVHGETTASYDAGVGRYISARLPDGRRLRVVPELI